jgi:oxygen-dependent protoporphyrinogen oxidase
VHVVVVGGGLAGTSAAFRLRERGHDVRLLEATGDLAGRARTIRRDGFTVDAGGDTIISFYARTLAALDAVGRRSELVRVSGRSGLTVGGELQVLRAAHPLSYARSRLFTLPEKARLTLGVAWALAQPRFDLFDLESLAERDGERSAADWSRRTLGDAAYERVVRPNIEARWYHAAEEAIAPLAIGLVQRAVTAQFYAVRGGMGQLAAWLAEGVDVHLRTPVTGVRADGGGVSVEVAGDERLRADAAVVATPAPAAAAILGGPAAEALTEIDYSANVRVALGYESDVWSDYPVDAVYPIETDGGIAGLGLSRHGTSAGRQLVDVHFDGRASRALSDAEAVDRARRAVDDLLGPTGAEPVLTEVVRWDAALPVPRPRRFRRLREVLAQLPPRVRLAGDYLAIGTIETAVRTGEEAAAALDG